MSAANYPIAGIPVACERCGRSDHHISITVYRDGKTVSLCSRCYDEDNKLVDEHTCPNCGQRYFKEVKP